MVLGFGPGIDLTFSQFTMPSHPSRMLFVRQEFPKITVSQSKRIGPLIRGSAMVICKLLG